jgi:beta-RFAP synthase
MFSFGDAAVRQFGGVGVMVKQPAVRIRACPATRFEVAGPGALRAEAFVRSWCESRERPSMPDCRIEILACPQTHRGVGTGTQLGLSVVAGLDTLLLPEPGATSAADLARAAGRGQRSAVGTYGFQLGGLILERGKLPREHIAPLEKRVPLPEAWRFLLMTPAGLEGLSGTTEHSAFAKLPPVPRETTDELLRLARDVILPAAAQEDFDEFSEATYRYGYLAGTCFAKVQGAPFADPRVVRLVEDVRNLGVRGVGQSSWGPTVFAVLPNAAEARKLFEHVKDKYASEDLRLVTTGPCNSGARIEVANV